MVLSSASIFDAMTGEYDEWYDSLDGSVLYRCELKCIKPVMDNCRPPLLEIGVGTSRFAMHYPGSVGVDPAFNSLLMAKAREVNTAQAYG